MNEAEQTKSGQAAIVVGVSHPLCLTPSFKKESTKGKGKGSGQGSLEAELELGQRLSATADSDERDRLAGAKAGLVRHRLGLSKRAPLPLRPAKGNRASTPRPLVMSQGARADFSQPVFEEGRELAGWEWEQEHKEIAAAIAGEQDAAKRLLALCERAAAKAGRSLLRARGVVVSETSLQDAASDAVLSVLSAVPRFEHLTAKDWRNGRVLRALAVYARRGAGRSLWSWSNIGMTGDNTRKRGDANACHYVDWSDWAAETLREAAPSARQGEFERATRWRVVRWVYRLGYQAFVRDLPLSRGRSAAIRAALSRCRVVGNVIMGESLTDALAMSGFASPKSFAEACDKAGFWHALSASALRDCPRVKQARAEMRLYAVDCAYAAQELAKLGAAPFALSAPEHRGRRVGSFGWARARAKWSGDAGATAKWRQAYQLWADYSHAKEMAIHYRDVATRARAEQAEAWRRVQAGLKSERFGDLRRVTGLVDSLGRRIKRRAVTI